MAETIWNSAVSVYHFMMDNLVVINILLSLVIVFFQRRSPQTVWTWLLLLYFIPILGFVLYLLIGQDFHKSRMFKAKEIEGEIKIRGTKAGRNNIQTKTPPDKSGSGEVPRSDFI